MVFVEYRYPWVQDRWRRFCSAEGLEEAIERLDACRIEHPGSECRIRSEHRRTAIPSS